MKLTSINLDELANMGEYINVVMTRLNDSEDIIAALRKHKQELHAHYRTAAEDATAEARDEVASLKDALEMKQVSNDAIDKEAGELRAEVKELKERNKTAIGRCACKQRTINQLREDRTADKKELQRAKAELTSETVLTTKACEHRDDAKDALKQAEIAVAMLRADAANLRQKLYVKHYPLDGQIKAEEERDRLQEEVVDLRRKIQQRDKWHDTDREEIQDLHNRIGDLKKTEHVKIIHVPLIARM